MSLSSRISSLSSRLGAEIKSLKSRTVVTERRQPPTYTVTTGTVSSPGPYSWTLYRVRTNGFRPGVLRKVYAGDYEKTWVSGDFTPPFESMASFASRLGSPLVVNADAWADAGPMTGLQIQNGVLYRGFSGTPKGRHAIGVLPNGKLKVYDQNAGATGASVLAEGVTDTFVMGPPLVVDGVQQVLTTTMPSSEWDGPHEVTSRTILGQAANGDIMLIQVSKSGASAGVGGNEMARLAKDLGCDNAIILDGGGSTQSWNGGHYAILSTDTGGSRPVKCVIAIDAIPADLQKTSWVTDIDPTTVTLASGVSGSAGNAYRLIEYANGSKSISIKASFTSTSTFANGQLLFTLPTAMRAPTGGAWMYVTCPVNISGGSVNGITGIYSKGPLGEFYISKIISPSAFATTHRIDMYLNFDL